MFSGAEYGAAFAQKAAECKGPLELLVARSRYRGRWGESPIISKPPDIRGFANFEMADLEISLMNTVEQARSTPSLPACNAP